jgi:uncharacterized repeat protein (TIGR02543 family)
LATRDSEDNIISPFLSKRIKISAEGQEIILPHVPYNNVINVNNIIINTVGKKSQKVTAGAALREYKNDVFTFDLSRYIPDVSYKFSEVIDSSKGETTYFSGEVVQPIEEREYNLNYELNGVFGNFPATEILLANQLTTKPEDPLNQGYTFIGWNTASNGSGKHWNFAEDRMPANNLTLYAQWEEEPAEVSYALNYELNGGQGKFPPTEILLAN